MAASTTACAVRSHGAAGVIRAWLLIETLPVLLLAEAVPKMDAHYASMMRGPAWRRVFTRPRRAPPRYSPDAPTTLTYISKKDLAPT